MLKNSSSVYSEARERQFDKSRSRGRDGRRGRTRNRSSSALMAAARSGLAFAPNSATMRFGWSPSHDRLREGDVAATPRMETAVSGKVSGQRAVRKSSAGADRATLQLVLDAATGLSRRSCASKLLPKIVPSSAAMRPGISFLASGGCEAAWGFGKPGWPSIVWCLEPKRSLRLILD